MAYWALFVGKTTPRTGLYALAVCAKLYLNNGSMKIVRFGQEEDLLNAMTGVGIAEREQTRIVSALRTQVVP